MVVVCLAFPVRAEEPVAQGCVVLSAAKNGDGPQDFLAMLRIETSKADLSWDWVAMPAKEECPKGQPLVLFSQDQRVILLDANAKEYSYDMQQTDQGARARVLSRAILQDLLRDKTEAKEETLPLLNAQDAIVFGGEKTLTQNSISKPFFGLEARMGGAYLYDFKEGLHAIGPTVEMGVSLLDGQLALSIVRTHSWAAYPDGFFQLAPRVHDSGLLVMARGGFRLNDFLFRGGIGVGWQRMPFLPDIKDTDRERSDPDENSELEEELLELEELCRLGEDDACEEFERLEDQEQIERQDDEEPVVGAELQDLNSLSSIHGGMGALELELLWNFAGSWHMGVVTGIRTHVYMYDEIELDYSFTTQLVLGVTL